ncbi:hypothetical protein WYO_3659 [Methylobacterium sp. GXF4]|uniref:hypothetical protein n=1 Tax=Methylobacterium sp. GXF4 TaxID=1096546 RepID=UPI0002697CD9|nr:hypothetical protein [Methylobacterium sp. GXF4]EIZ83646.1 hypothetical protein WYO_3659 [Methylobacterium sp. GXF4]
MADRPIIFSAPMIRALLAGRKTQTRRILKLQPIPFAVDDQGTLCEVGCLHVEGDRRPRVTLGRVVTRQELPYAVGDRLYVREAWAPLDALTHNDPGVQALADRGFYKADESNVGGEITRWRPSIHMPRWASRLTLLVTEVRIERLNAMSAADAIAEGIQDLRTPEHTDFGIFGLVNAQHPVRAFWLLWDFINGEGAWLANPWVVAISFTVHQRNIDQLAPIAEAAE